MPTSIRVAERGTQWNSEQRANAALIIRVGKAMGMSTRDILIGLMTAMQESSLRNLRGGDRDSAGLFQQRPSVRYSNGRPYWGTYSQVTNPTYAARRFFTELKTVARRNKMSLTAAAQAVQRSAFPNAYAKWETQARKLLGEPVRTGAPGTAPPASPRSPRVAERGGALSTVNPLTMSPRVAERTGIGPTAGSIPEQQRRVTAPPTMSEMLGFGVSRFDVKPPTNPAEQWEETDVPGVASTAPPGVEPTSQAIPVEALDTSALDAFFDQSGDGDTGGSIGSGRAAEGVRAAIVNEARKYLGVRYVWGGANPNGFDCSGLIQYVFAKYGKKLPRVSFQQANAGKRVGLGDLQPGDLVAWDNSSRNNGADHIAIYIGNGQIIEAPRPGLSVRIRSLKSNEGAWGVRIL